MIVVTAAVIEHDGRYLVTRRQHGVHLEGLWGFRRRAEPGESPPRLVGSWQGTGDRCPRR